MHNSRYQKQNTQGIETKYSVRVVNTKFLRNGESFLDSVFNVIVSAKSKQHARDIVKETYRRPEYIVGNTWKKS